MIITSTRFGFEIEATAKIAKLHRPTYEVPISYYGRTYEEGKKILARDALYAFWYVLKYNALVSLKKSFRTIPETTASAQSRPLRGKSPESSAPSTVSSQRQ
jgi:hypothetical protein